MDRKTKREKLLQVKKTLSDAGLYVVSAERFDEPKGFAVVLPPGFTGSKTIPFLFNGGLRLFMHTGFDLIIL